VLHDHKINERRGLRLGSRVSFCMEGIDGLISPFRFNRREVSTNLRDGNAGKCKFSSDIELENLCSGCMTFFIMNLWFGLASDS